MTSQQIEFLSLLLEEVRLSPQGSGGADNKNVREGGGIFKFVFSMLMLVCFSLLQDALPITHLARMDEVYKYNTTSNSELKYRCAENVEC